MFQIRFDEYSDWFKFIINQRYTIALSGVVTLDQQTINLLIITPT